jgi:transcriptional regulator with XRE-family HTH domain
MDTDAKIRAEIDRVMHEKRMTQAQLARKLGVKPQSVYPVLRGARGKQPQSLLDILDALDLELTVKPKELEPMDAETRAWLEADLAPPLEPDAHGELEPDELGGEPLRYEPGRGWVSDG